MSTDDAKSVKPVGTNDIQLYSLATPNGMKVSVLLEELGIKYDAHTIPIGGPNALNKTPWFLEMNPNNKIPVIQDLKGADGKVVTLFESGAILIYLADKYGKFIPKDVQGRYTCIQWLMFQMGGIGPMMGQLGYFYNYANEDVPHAKKRYKEEVQRLLGVVEKRLSVSPYLAGDEYTIADIANYTWIKNIDTMGTKAELDLTNIPHLRKWLDTIAARPAVEKAKSVTPFPK